MSDSGQSTTRQDQFNLLSSILNFSNNKPGEEIENISEASPFGRNLFSKELIADISEAHAKTLTRIEFIQDRAIEYCNNQSAIGKIVTELEDLTDKMQGRAITDPDQIEYGNRYGELSREIETVEARQTQITEELGGNPDDNPEEQIFIAVNNAYDLMEKALLSEETMAQMNATTVLKDVLPAIYAKARTNATEKLNKDELVEDLKKFIGAELSEMNIGVDHSNYWGSPLEELVKQTVAENNEFKEEFRRKYHTSSPFSGSFISGRQSQTADDDYKNWVKAFLNSKRFDTRQQILSDISENGLLDNDLRENALDILEATEKSVSSKYATVAKSYTPYFLDDHKSFQKVPVIGEVLYRAGTLSEDEYNAVVDDIFKATTNSLMTGNGKTENIALEMEHLREPEKFIAASIEYLSENGINHQTNSHGNNAFSCGYIRALEKLNSENKLDSIASHLEERDRKAAFILADRNSGIRGNVEEEYLAAFIANPENTVMREELLNVVRKDLSQLSQKTLLTKGFENTYIQAELVKHPEEVAKIIASSHASSYCKGATKFASVNHSNKPLIRTFANSEKYTSLLLKEIAHELSEDENLAKEFADAALKMSVAQTIIGRMELLENLMNANNSNDPETKSTAIAIIENIAKGNLEAPINKDDLKDTAPATAIGQVLTKDWDPKNEVMVIGEEHTAIGQAAATIEGLKDLQRKGMTDLALEIPGDLQEAIDAFLRENIDDNVLWQEYLLPMIEGGNTEEKALSMKLILDYAKENNLNIHSIDISKADHEAINAAAEENGIDPNNFEYYSAPEHIRDMFYLSRNIHMANKLAIIKNVNPDAGVASLVGAAHAIDLGEERTIGHLLKQNGIAARNIELIGGDVYKRQDFFDNRLNKEIELAGQNDRHQTLYSGKNRTESTYIHIPQRQYTKEDLNQSFTQPGQIFGQSKPETVATTSKSFTRQSNHQQTTQRITKM